MHKRRKPTNLPDIKKLYKEVEKFTSTNKSGKSRLNYIKKELKQIGLEEKKSFIPLKHRLLLIKHKKNKEKQEIEEFGMKIKKRRK